MIPRLDWFAFSLGLWVAGSSALVYTNSFNGWVGNSTYTLTWDSSANDPDYYDLTIARPTRVPVPGDTVDIKTPVDYYYRFANQIPKNGAHVLNLTLPPALYPGIYFMVMESQNNTALTTAFAISPNSSVVTSTFTSIAAPSPTTVSLGDATTTFGSYIQVTATRSGVVTQDGHTVTVKPSDVFSSAVVYTTIIVESGPGKGTPAEKTQMIVGLVLGIGALIALPIIVWLVLRYRRRPKGLDKNANWDKHTPYKIETATNSSAVELLDQSGTNNATDGTRRVWAIINGEKRLIIAPQNYQQQPLLHNPDPFADPPHTSTLSRPQHLPRLSIPGTPLYATNASPPTTTPNETLLSNPNTAVPSPSNTVLSLSRSQIEEKASQPRSQRPSPSTPRMLTPDEVATRIFVPGRAVDMGPLGRARTGDVDENGLLPPDYSQAIQPLSPSSHTTQAEPGRTL